MLRPLFFGALAAVAVVGVLPSVAAATLKVYSPIVEYRELEVEWRAGYDVDARASRDGTFKNLIGAGYGVLPRLFLESYAEIEHAPGGEAEVEAIEAEGKLQLTEAGEYWLDAGLLFEYEFGLENENDAVSGSLLLQKETGSLLHLANLIAERPLGSGDTVETGVSWSTRYRAGRFFEPAIEYHGRFGPVSGGTPFDRQTHYAGPVAYGRLGSLRYDVGYLFGLSDAAADGLIKWNLEYEIRF